MKINATVALGALLLLGSLAVNIYLLYDRPLPVSTDNRSSDKDERASLRAVQQHKPPSPTSLRITTSPGDLDGNYTIKVTAKPLNIAPKVIDVGSMDNTRAPESTASVVHGVVSWNQFAAQPHLTHNRHSIDRKARFLLGCDPVICPAEVDSKLAAPQLTADDFQWCQWALSESGGRVVVGKSWGKLNSPERQRFDKLQCNSVSNGKNPSCDDSWGDKHMREWRKNKVESLQCESGRPSQINCMKNDNGALYCELENAMIDFSKVKKIERPGNTPSKTFQNEFISTDCKKDKKEPDFPFPHLYSAQLSQQRCDVVYNGTLLMYSHDDIRNLGHTLNDVMNVWVMLWMSGTARLASTIDMLNIDSFKLGHNFDDEPNAFFSTYRKALRRIYKGIDFQGKTLCVKKLLIQPTPPLFFIWESWFVNMPCSFVGPSSLYQRWNLHARQAWGLLGKERILETTQEFKLLLIVRNEHSNMWGNQRTSRNFLNADELTKGLSNFVESRGAQFKLIVQDLSKLQFQEQLKLISSTSLMIGMHGAGIASSMHMSIGTKYCCGVLEIYPQGEFFPILGHGNMVRKMGLHYDRLDLSDQNSKPNGGYVPVKDLIAKTSQMIDKILDKPTCIRNDVLVDPFLLTV